MTTVFDSDDPFVANTAPAFQPPPDPPGDDDNPFAGIAIPETAFSADPDLLDPQAVLPLLDGAWFCLTDDQARLDALVSTIRDSELISLLADFAEWQEHTIGPDPEAHAFASAAEAKAATLEDAGAFLNEYGDELSGMPREVQELAAARLTASSVLAICLSELGLMPAENQQFWTVAW